MNKKKPATNARRQTLNDQLKADAEAMLAMLRRAGRDVLWIEENYPRDWANQCFILQGLLASD